jgi:hypothetical protein
MMKMNADRGSAMILRFPRGGRAGLTASRTVTEVAASAPKMAVGDAWYHDAAIRDERNGKH